jgi:signal recognition particle receptor subunit beta
MNDLKIVLTGTMGAGKTTAIRAISDGAALSTEVPPSEGATAEKSLTTVGFDHGSCRLGEGMVLKLFGTPGQARFRFMWDILATGAFGLIVLADNRSDDPVADVAGFLAAFAPQVPQRRMVVGVGRSETHPLPSVEDYHTRLARAGFEVPVLAVDVRRADDVRLLLSVLVGMAEVDDV